MKTESFEFEENRFCVKVSPSGEFVYNSFVIKGRESVLIHTGRKKFFEATLAVVREVIDPAQISYIGFSHFEADECGALNEWLEVAPTAVPLVGAVGRASIEDLSSRTPRCLHDGEVIDLGSIKLEMLETPHCPHGWDACLFFDQTERILYSSDLGAQPSYGEPISEDFFIRDIVEFQRRFGFLSEGIELENSLSRLLELKVRVLATQHGSLLKGERRLNELFTEIIKNSKNRDTSDRVKVSCEDF